MSSPYILSIPWWIPEAFMSTADGVPVKQARREMFDDRVGEEHMRLNVRFNASALIRVQPGCSTEPQFNSFV